MAWWSVAAVVGIGAVLLVGAIIRFGKSTLDQDDDYMIGDDEFDWGDKS